MTDFTRRTFLQTAALSTGTSLLMAEPNGKKEASERLQVGVMGTGGRALSLIRGFASNSEAEVKVLMDIDTRKFPTAIKEVENRQGSTPRIESDFRKLIDDPALDVLVVGTPDHWHAIPTILACQAGKDVYVEKPDGHNMEEGKRMVAAMKKHKRIVQLGTQARSTERMRTAIEFIRQGGLGKCYVAKAWESARQGNIGFPKDGTPPKEVDYDTWLGPAPKRPFNPNRFHGRWRWFYDYGTGDLGNDGVHRLDEALWALQTACEFAKEPVIGLPNRITASGGKWFFNDMQEWPDTLQVNYEFDGPSPKLITYEMRLWAPYVFHGETEGAAIYGEKGYLLMGNSRWRAIGPGNKLLAEGSGGNDASPHIQNFIDCVKSRQKPNADLETVGHPSSLLCHMGNVSTRVKRQVVLDSKTETFFDDNEANRLRTRPTYRKPFLLPEV